MDFLVEVEQLKLVLSNAFQLKKVVENQDTEEVLLFYFKHFLAGVKSEVLALCSYVLFTLVFSNLI